MNIYQWNGTKSDQAERAKAAEWCRAIAGERKGLSKINVYEEGDADAKGFFAPLGGIGPIKSAEAGNVDLTPSRPKRLFRLSDNNGKLVFTKVMEGRVTKKMFDSSEYFILNSYFHPFFISIILTNY